MVDAIASAIEDGDSVYLVEFNPPHPGSRHEKIQEDSDLTVPV